MGNLYTIFKNSRDLKTFPKTNTPLSDSCQSLGTSSKVQETELTNGDNVCSTKSSQGSGPSQGNKGAVLLAETSENEVGI